jgi:hypothetical protein
MNWNWDSLTRRKLLAGLGGTSLASGVGLGVATGESVGYTSASSTKDCSGFALRSEWRETYTRDGETVVLENTTAPESGETGTENSDPQTIRLNNILPGDSGGVGFRLTADPEQNSSPFPVQPNLAIEIRDRAENGIIDPEREAGDDPDDPEEPRGELQEYLNVTVWEDNGLFEDLLDTDRLGAENLENDIGEPSLNEGSLEEVAGTQEALSEISGENDSTAVAFRWAFTGGANINVTQGDSVTFVFDVGCGGNS